MTSMPLTLRTMFGVVMMWDCVFGWRLAGSLQMR